MVRASLAWPQPASAHDGFVVARMPSAHGLPKAVDETGRGRVLVVEDEEVVRSLVVEILEAEGYHVAWAENGTVALEKLRSGPPVDVLFTDIVMPDGPNGVELARLASAMLPGVRVLLASGYSRHILVGREGLDPGVTFLPKPYRLTQMLAALANLLDAD